MKLAQDSMKRLRDLYVLQLIALSLIVLRSRNWWRTWTPH